MGEGLVVSGMMVTVYIPIGLGGHMEDYSCVEICAFHCVLIYLGSGMQ